jgi:hypothetical protein
MDRSTSQTRSGAHQARRKLGGQQPGGRAGGQHRAGPPGASARCCAAWAWSRWLRSRAPWSLVSARAPDGGSRAARIRRPGRGAALPGQLPHDVAVGRAEVGVGLQPPGPALLMLAQRQFRLGGPVGLLASHHHRVRSDAGRRLLPAQAKHPRTLPLGAVARSSSRARSRGAWSSSRWSRSRSARSSRVDSRHRFQAAGGVDHQGLVAGARERLSELVVAVARLSSGQGAADE